MILSESYHRIMEKIEVTDEMRERILKNIQAAGCAKKDSELSSGIQEGCHDFLRGGKNPRWNLSGTAKRYLAVAACFVILLVGMVAVLKVSQPVEESPDPNHLVLGPAGDIVECFSVEELSEKVGFEVGELSGFPFPVQSVSYYVYWGELAQVEYLGEDGESILYRKSRGEGDNSGDYNSYANVVTEEVEGIEVTLKGDGEKYTLALWQKDGYSVSFNSSEGMAREEILDVVKAAFR